jgi:2-polyprenyl-3-methyl-5-hydroxy-6-metoxy-1,4-benzoquinol methylase
MIAQSARAPIDYEKQKFAARTKSVVVESKATKIRYSKMVLLVGSNKKVLDVGCYDGTCGELLIKNKNEVYGIEACPEAAELAKIKGLYVKIGDIESGLDFENNFFDVVMAGEIIEHIVDTDFFIDEIKRVLKTNGFLVLSTPNAASLGRRLLLLFGKNPFFEASFSYPLNFPGHMRFFTKDLLLEFLKYKGFDKIIFESNAVSFTRNAMITSKTLADIFPTFGGILIVKAKVKK